MVLDGSVLLMGPRGRRLCLELAMGLNPMIESAVFWLAYDLDPRKGTTRVMMTADSCELSDPQPRPSMTDLVSALTSFDVTLVEPDVIDRALAAAVDTSRPWQEPDGEDVLAGLPDVQRALAPIAGHVMRVASTRWWSQERQAEQWVIDWRTVDAAAPTPGKPSQDLSTWARDARAEEVQAVKERPSDPHAAWSGTWWSFPGGAVQSVGQLPLGLDLIEDSMGWADAIVIPVRGAGRTYEVRTGDDWVSLCRDYPLNVTASRRHDWFRCTGSEGGWVIPDWEKVAKRWDAVHVTVLAYLSSANRALEVDADVSTVMAGWDPDSTVWLSDVESDSSAQRWRRAGDQEPWMRISP